MRPEYSARAARAISRLKRAYNDIEVFVEDTKCRNMWVELIKGILPTGMRLKSVNQLGGRAKVLEACKRDQQDDGRKKLYIIDGDFDYALSIKKPKLKHLYRLKAYCVENLFVNKISVAYIGSASKPEWSETKIQSEFNFGNWISDVEKQLKPLFKTYALAHHLSLGITTTGYSVTKLFHNTPDGPIIDARKLKNRVFGVLMAVRRAVNKQTFLSAFHKINQTFSRLSCMECISGKDYLMPLFEARLQRVLSFRGTSEQLKVHLARAFAPSIEPWLVKRIRSICS